VTLLFEVKQDLLYITPKGKLCIPNSVHEEVIQVAHDISGYGGLDRMLHYLGSITFIKIRAHVKDYVTHCPECYIKMTCRHAPYGSLQLIIASNTLFHMICIDLILGLPETG
jgi:hypothetical protein